MAAGDAESTWFERHGSTPITELPDHWPEPYRRVVERRIELIESDRSIRLLEKPGAQAPLELGFVGGSPGGGPREVAPRPAGGGGLLVRPGAHDHRAAGGPLHAETRPSWRPLGCTPVESTWTLPISSPGLSRTRRSPSQSATASTPPGLRRRREWEKVWELQRREDDIDARTELPEDDPSTSAKPQAERHEEGRGA